MPSQEEAQGGLSGAAPGHRRLLDGSIARPPGTRKRLCQLIPWGQHSPGSRSYPHPRPLPRMRERGMCFHPHKIRKSRIFNDLESLNLC